MESSSGEKGENPDRSGTVRRAENGEDPVQLWDLTVTHILGAKSGQQYKQVEASLL